MLYLTYKIEYLEYCNCPRHVFHQINIYGNGLDSALSWSNFKEVILIYTQVTERKISSIISIRVLIFYKGLEF